MIEKKGSEASSEEHVSRHQRQRQTYSSVAFISGQDCGEQNSVIDP